jgi:SAM-dependent methyltransferase
MTLDSRGDGLKRILRPLIERARVVRTRALSLVMQPRQLWQRELRSEVRFWKEYLDGKGLQFSEDYATRLNPETPLQLDLAELLGLSDGPVRVLDVGAGPLTVLGKNYQGRKLDITAVDALADAYDEELRKLSVVPPVRTTACETEKLTNRFGTGVFDLVYAQNTLDHTYDPARCVREMVAVGKPGAVIAARHKNDEARVEAYEGLHQWNLTVEDGRWLLWNRSNRIDLFEEVAADADPILVKDEGDWHFVALRKRRLHD